MYSSGKSQSGASQYHIVLKSLLTELAERKAENEKLAERIERLEVFAFISLDKFSIFFIKFLFLFFK